VSIQGYQESSISAALSERRSRLAKIEPSIVTKVVSFICFQDQEVLLCTCKFDVIVCELQVL